MSDILGLEVCVGVGSWDGQKCFYMEELELEKINKIKQEPIRKAGRAEEKLNENSNDSSHFKHTPHHTGLREGSVSCSVTAECYQFFWSFLITAILVFP